MADKRNSKDRMQEISGGIGIDRPSIRIEEKGNKKGKYNICREFKKILMEGEQDHIII